MTEKSTKDRLIAFISQLGISVNKFETLTSLPMGTIKNSRGDFKTETIRKIWEVYPDIDIVWLILGESSQDIHIEGTGNAIQSGDNNSYNASDTINKLIDEMAAQREAKDMQIDRLLGLLEAEKGRNKGAN